MDAVFQGAAELSLDAKGRLAIPTKHRDGLQSSSDRKLVLTAHPHRCLLLYPADAWTPNRTRIMGFSSFDPQSALWKRLLVGAWTRANKEPVMLLPALDGHGVEMVFRRTSTLSRAECGELLEFVNAWAAENMPAREPA